MRYYLSMINIKMKSGFKDEIAIFMDRELTDPDGEIVISELGYYPNAQFHYRQRKRGCEQFILIKCLKGIGYVRVNRTIHKITANEIAIIPKSIPHMYWADEQNPWSIHWIHFHGPYVLKNYPVLKHFHIQNLYRNQNTSITSTFITLIDNLSIHMKKSTIDHANMSLKYILSTMFVDIIFEKNEKTNHVENAVNYMKSNIFSTLTLTQVAKECNISKSQLSLLFSREKNSSPINYFLNMKIDLAVKYLLLTDMSVKEISYKLGFKDQYYFSRLFKNHKGSSPLKFKKENELIINSL